MNKISTNLKKHSNYLFLLIILISIIFFLMLMKSIGEIQLLKIGETLQYNNNNNNLTMNVLLARFKQNLNRNHDADIVSYLNEGKANAILSHNIENSFHPKLSYPFLRKISIMIINATAIFSRSNPIIVPEDDTGRQLMQVAYFFERHYQYSKASVYFNKSLKYFKSDKRTYAYIKLHLAFVFANMGKFIKSQTILRQMVSDKTINHAASQLRKYISIYDSRLKSITESELSSTKAMSYYHNMALEKAITAFNQLKKSQETPTTLFYKGRTYEKTGKLNHAINDYLNILRRYPTSTMAKLANRRLFILSSYYSKNEKLNNLSKRYAKKFNDTNFIEKASEISKNINLEQEKRLIKNNANTEISSETEFSDLNLTEHFDIIPEKATNGTKHTVKAKIHATSSSTAISQIVIKPVSIVSVKSSNIKRLSIIEAKSQLLHKNLSFIEKTYLINRTFSELDKIILNNGNIIVGIITSKTKNQYFLSTYSKNLIIVQKDIDRITKVRNTKKVNEK